MEPFEIRTTPARLPRLTIVAAVLLLGSALFLLWLEVRLTVLVVRRFPDDPSQRVLCVALVLLGYGLTWFFLRLYAPTIQVVSLYLFRDRGKQVVAFRLDAAGWRYVIAGTDVVIPWGGMTVEVTERTDDQYHIRVTSGGAIAVGRDPFSRQLQRTLRKEGGIAVPFTMSNPTEDELASAIAHQSAGRVVLAR